MPKVISRKPKKKFVPKWHKATVHSTTEFWNTKVFISSGKERYPKENAYFIDSDGVRQYHRRFLPGVVVYIDPEKIETKFDVQEKTCRRMLDRFYELKLKPLTFKWIKAKNRMETSHWVVVYPAHYLVKVEMSETRFMEASDHLATLYYRSSNGLVAIAHQHYEGHLKGNYQYHQPYLLRSELRTWRKNRIWFQDAITREELHEI